MKLILKFNLILILMFLIGLASSFYIANDLLQKNAREEIHENARIMMESALAVRAYTVSQIKPLLETQMRYHFLPQTVPSYSATEYFNNLRKSFPEYMYKEATINPTNLRDRAEGWEVDVVSHFRENADAKELVGERMGATGPMLYLAGAQIVSVPYTLPLQRANAALHSFLYLLVGVFVFLFLTVNFLLYSAAARRSRASADRSIACGAAWSKRGTCCKTKSAMPHPSLSPLKSIGKYEIVDALGTGGMGTVFRAFDPTLERIVAVKLLQLDTQEVSPAELSERFRNEARAVARLNHPSIVAIFDYDDQDPAGAYIAMEYVNGCALDEYVQQRAELLLEDAISAMHQVLAGLDYAHRRDVHAAGVVLYELMTGAAPFSGSAAEIMHQVCISVRRRCRPSIPRFRPVSTPWSPKRWKNRPTPGMRALRRSRKRCAWCGIRFPRSPRR